MTASETFPETAPETVDFQLDGVAVSVPAVGSLLDALRDHLGVVSAKDGCAPQGQCGCCTVWVDGDPRVACVTPVRRVGGRTVTTTHGVGDALATWANALVSHGGTQCGFCTPGIIMRLEALRRRGSLGDTTAVRRGLAAHLCRCTGYQGIVDAAAELADAFECAPSESRDWDAAAARAQLELGRPQGVGPHVACGEVGFADDSAPTGAAVAMPTESGEWILGSNVAETRVALGNPPGRRSTAAGEAPVELPAGDWAITLCTGWVDAGYLETDVSWCEPGGTPASPAVNGGAFGGKAASPLPAAAAALAEQTGGAVRARWRREDAIRFSPKRPPLAIGLRADGSGAVRVARTPGVVDAIRSVAPEFEIEEVDVAGPPTSLALRGAGWIEVAAVRAALRGDHDVTAPSGGRARAELRRGDGTDLVVRVEVWAGASLDDTVLRSYCFGAVHQGIGWATSEGLKVAADGDVLDLTIRSLGMLRAADTPRIEVIIQPDDRPAVPVSDAVAAAVAAAVWNDQGRPECWPSGRPLN
jgi:aerobic-type carbon monoxide dehydrogenase small subunit (CoxS/CutS family)